MKRNVSKRNLEELIVGILLLLCRNGYGRVLPCNNMPQTFVRKEIVVYLQDIQFEGAENVSAASQPLPQHSEPATPRETSVQDQIQGFPITASLSFGSLRQLHTPSSSSRLFLSGMHSWGQCPHFLLQLSLQPASREHCQITPDAGQAPSMGSEAQDAAALRAMLILRVLLSASVRCSHSERGKQSRSHMLCCNGCQHLSQRGKHSSMGFSLQELASDPVRPKSQTGPSSVSSLKWSLPGDVRQAKELNAPLPFKTKHREHLTNTAPNPKRASRCLCFKKDTSKILLGQESSGNICLCNP